jgi:tetratricopeptide (TPR) repeat protein
MSDEEKDDEISQVEELFYEGADLQGEGRYDEAMACFEKCLALDPQYADALLGMAMVFVAREQFDEAIAVGLRLSELQPDDPLAYTNLSLDWKRQLAEDDKAD